MEMFRRKHTENQHELRLGIMLQQRPADPLSLILNEKFDTKTETEHENQKTQKKVGIMIHGICVYNDEKNLKYNCSEEEDPNEQVLNFAPSMD